MDATVPLTTNVSTKGQVILPKAIRDRRKWAAGTKLVVEETSDGVLLRAAPLFTPTRIEDVAGSLKYSGPPITDEAIEASIMAEAERRYARDRY
jgi:AbrB family looped-hinge helix DNA binding protein